MNTSPESHQRNQPQRLRYLTPEQLGQPAHAEAGRRPLPAFLLPTEDDSLSNNEALAAEKIINLESQIARLERELPVNAERSRREGEEAGHGQAKAEFERALAQSRNEFAASLEAFRDERREYFRRVESEVVKLALAIARKILHREAQMDSTLLTGIVRAALDRLEESTSTVLRVPQPEAGAWKTAIANLPRPPALAEDARLRPGACMLESQMGTIELSLDAQLQEIERGFFDLLQEGPARRSNTIAEQAGMKGRAPGANA